MTNTQEHATWGELLHSAVHTPGKLLAAYTAFHNYSFGNALLALEQCISRKIEPGPLNSYKGWLQLKRQVRKGEKGLCLCMPVTYKKRVTGKAAPENIGIAYRTCNRLTGCKAEWPKRVVGRDRRDQLVDLEFGGEMGSLAADVAKSCDCVFGSVHAARQSSTAERRAKSLAWGSQ